MVSGSNSGEVHGQNIESILWDTIQIELINNPELVERLTRRVMDIIRERYPEIVEEFSGQLPNVSPSLSTQAVDSTGQTSAVTTTTSSMQYFNAQSSLAPCLAPPPTSADFTSPINLFRPPLMFRAQNSASSEIIQRHTIPAVAPTFSHSSQSMRLSRRSLSSLSAQPQPSSFTDFTTDIELQSSPSSMNHSNSRQTAFESNLETLNVTNASHQVGNMFQFQGNAAYPILGSSGRNDLPGLMTAQTPLFFGNAEGEVPSMSNTSFDLAGYQWRATTQGVTSEPLDTLNMLAFPYTSIPNMTERSDQDGGLDEYPRES
jgi:hypothetical protein